MSIAITNPPRLSPGEVSFVCQFIRTRSGISLDANKLYLIEARLETVCKSMGYGSLNEIIQHLRNGPSTDLMRQVVDAMTTNETSFFRDLKQFDLLKNRILPNTIAAKKEVRELRLWSAACATGQEPYSIAMLLREHFPALHDWNIEILATDICNSVLERAREGAFSQLEVNRGLPIQMLLKYFVQIGRDWQVIPAVKNMVQFRSVNLTTNQKGLGKFDIIFCKNVLIYFDLEEKRRLLTQLQSMLTGGGTLLLGGAETVLNIVEGFERIHIDGAVCYTALGNTKRHEN